MNPQHDRTRALPSDAAPSLFVRAQAKSLPAPFQVNRSRMSCDRRATWRGSVPDSPIDPSSILPRERRTPTDRTWSTGTLFRTCFAGGFHRKAIRRDELYAPSCQRLTRRTGPLPFGPPRLTYVCVYARTRTAFHLASAPRGALAKQRQPDTHLLQSSSEGRPEET